MERWAIGASPRLPVPTADILHYPTFDSVGGKPRTIDLILKRPSSGFRPPWPVMINLHGGPASQWRPEWDARDALFQRMGIAILEPNVRGSTGFGKTFAKLDEVDNEKAPCVMWARYWTGSGRVPISTHCASVSLAVVWRISVLATMVHYSNAIRCGVDLFGIADLAANVEASSQEMFVDIQRAEYGDERDSATRAFLDSISPINHVANITVPILIFQGANDVRVKPDQSRKMVAQLQTLGREVRFIEANNEGHGINMPVNQLYLGAAVADFVRSSW